LYKVYDQKVRWSDGWDATDHAQDYNFSVPFFQQFNDLYRKVPKISLSNTGSENSEYVNYSRSLKNCYLCFWLGASEDCYNIQTGQGLKNCVDCSYITICEHCYELIDSNMCFNAFFSQCCSNSNNLSHCYDMENCSFCSYCVGLVNASYCILNEIYEKEAYFKKLEEISNDRKRYETQFRSLYLKIPRKYGQFVQTTDCTWNVLLWSKNSQYCFDSIKLEDCKYVTSAWWCKNVQDGTSVNVGSEFTYRTQATLWFNSLYINDSIGLTDCMYCDQCFDSSHLFGCIGIRNKKYCICNKQYTKEEYETLVSKIIEHMQKNNERWEFFPAIISVFWYNETVAQEYFPLTKQEALTKWYKRTDEDCLINIPANAQTVNAQDLPENIQDITDDILNEVIICEVTGRPFRVIKPELEFYRKHNLPIPHKHPDQRYLERIHLRNPRKLRERKCAKCWTDIQTSYTPERPEIVYCEVCYNKEIYG
jgi:hypothetical protein